MKHFSFVILTLALLTSCTSPGKDLASAHGNIGAQCTTNADCVTPMNYLMRSSCPFTSVCTEGRCVVACPMAFHDADPEVSKSYPVQCLGDADCSCADYFSIDLKKCSCVNNSCMAIVAE